MAATCGSRQRRHASSSPVLGSAAAEQLSKQRLSRAARLLARPEQATELLTPVVQLALAQPSDELLSSVGDRLPELGDTPALQRRTSSTTATELLQKSCYKTAASLADRKNS